MDTDNKGGGLWWGKGWVEEDKKDKMETSVKLPTIKNNNQTQT